MSLTLTPLVIEDGLARWDGLGEQVPCDGYAVLFGRSIAAVIPDDLPPELSLSVMDVCGAPALTHRVVASLRRARSSPSSAAPASPGSLSLAAARGAGAGRTIGVVPHRAGGGPAAPTSGLADEVVVADARDPIALRAAVAAAGGPADVTVVCVDVPGCEGGAILATADGGTVIFFSMATSFSAAALGAEGLAADVTMLVGNGYVPGHAAYAMDLLRSSRACAACSSDGSRPTRRETTGDQDRGQAQARPEDVRQARALARKVGRPIVKLAKEHTTVSVERATLRLAGLAGADAEGMPWVNRLVDCVRADVGLEHGVALPVWDALRRGEADDLPHPGPEGVRRLRAVPAARRASAATGPASESRRSGPPAGSAASTRSAVSASG